MSDISPTMYALRAEDPASGTSILQSIDERLIDDAITRMVVSGYQNIRIQPAHRGKGHSRDADGRGGRRRSGPADGVGDDRYQDRPYPRSGRQRRVVLIARYGVYFADAQYRVADLEFRLGAGGGRA